MISGFKFVLNFNSSDEADNFVKLIKSFDRIKESCLILREISFVTISYYDNQYDVNSMMDIIYSIMRNHGGTS